MRKKCSKCGKVKSALADNKKSKFHKSKSTKGGFQSSCKECRNADMLPRSRAYYWQHQAVENRKRKRRYLLNKVERFRKYCRGLGLQASGKGAAIRLGQDPIKVPWLGWNWVAVHLKRFNLKLRGSIKIERLTAAYREATFSVQNLGRRPK